MVSQLKGEDSGSDAGRWKLSLICLVGAAVVVAIVAGFWPRAFAAGDDEAIVRHLRQDTLAPYISPVLSEVLSLGYRISDPTPWYGIYLYAVHAVALATLFWMIAILARGSRLIRGVALVAASVIYGVIVFRLTFTITSLVACGFALIGWVVESQRAMADGDRVRLGVAGALGALLALGFASRTLGLMGGVASVAPLLGWHAWRLFRERRGPRPVAVLALVGPSLALVLLSGVMPQTWDERVQRFEQFNGARGAIHNMAAFGRIHRRAPELLAEIGFTYGEWRDFIRWLFFDEERYTLAKVKALADSGGRPRTLRYAEAKARTAIAKSWKKDHVIRFAVFALALAALLAALRIRRFGLAWGFLALWVCYIYALAVWLLSYQRWPTRVSMGVYLVSAVGMLAFVLARRPRPRPPPTAVRRAALLAAAVITTFTASQWLLDLRRFEPRPRDNRAQLAFERRLGDRYTGGAVIIKDAGAHRSSDPLAPPRPYEVLPLGWGTFSVPFYNELERLGLSRGADLVPAIIDNPRVFILAKRKRRTTLLKYLQRYDERASLKRVDRARRKGVIELYQVVRRPVPASTGQEPGIDP